MSYEVAQFTLVSRLTVALILASWSVTPMAQMSVSPNGKGDVMIFPFYTAMGDNWTEFAIHNGANHSKALDLKVREGLGGNTAIGFHIYLAAGETFRGAVRSAQFNANVAAIGGRDDVCTVPELASYFVYEDAGLFGYQEMFSYSYEATDSFAGRERTLSGSIEVIEMGQWPAQSGVFWDADNISDCQWLVHAWSIIGGVPGEWRADPGAHALDWQAGGLSGASVIHTSQNGDIAIAPIVLKGFAKRQKPAEYHVEPGGKGDEPWPAPNLRNGTNLFTAPRFGSEVMSARSGLQAVAALLAVTEARVSEPSLAAMPETQTMVVSFPTKYLHTEATAESPTSPFTELWKPDSSEACEAMWMSNDETIWPDNYIRAKKLELCAATNVIGSGASSSLYADDWVLTKAPEVFDYPFSLSFAYSQIGSSPSTRQIEVFDRSGKKLPILGMPAYVLPISQSASVRRWREDPIEFVSPTAVQSDQGNVSEESILRLNLEAPSVSESYSGVGTLRGWAIAEEGINNIEVYINGTFFQNAPYGGKRGDVANVYPEIEEASDSGFALAFNYGNLSEGSHTVRVVATTKSGRQVEQSSRFSVAKFHKSYISSSDEVDLDAAYCSVRDNKISVVDALIDGKMYDISMKWRTSDQGFAIYEIKGVD